MNIEELYNRYGKIVLQIELLQNEAVKVKNQIIKILSESNESEPKATEPPMEAIIEKQLNDEKP